MWFIGQLLRSGIEAARPVRDIGVDLVSYAPDADWATFVQLKTVGMDGLTVHAKYLGQPVAMVYVLLGDVDGGTAGRRQTSAFMMTPEQAWSLPTGLGLRHDADSAGTYRFSTLTRALLARLEDFRVPADAWAQRLSSLAPLRFANLGTSE